MSESEFEFPCQDMDTDGSSCSAEEIVDNLRRDLNPTHPLYCNRPTVLVSRCCLERCLRRIPHEPK